MKCKTCDNRGYRTFKVYGYLYDTPCNKCNPNNKLELKLNPPNVEYNKSIYDKAEDIPEVIKEKKVVESVKKEDKIEEIVELPKKKKVIEKPKKKSIKEKSVKVKNKKKKKK